MPEEREVRVLDIERLLGFRWRRGISRERSNSSKVPVVKEFLDAIDNVNTTYLETPAAALRSSVAFGEECQRLFDFHGPRLWPDPAVDTSAWLCDSSQDDLGGSWPRNLTYSNPDDRKT